MSTPVFHLEDGYPDIEGQLDLRTGNVVYQGTVYTWSQWKRFVASVYRAIHKRLCANRDTESDVQNLPGVKPVFHDDWLGIVPDTHPRRRG